MQYKLCFQICGVFQIFLKFQFFSTSIVPRPRGFVYFIETFENIDDFKNKWKKSEGFKFIGNSFQGYKGVFCLALANTNDKRDYSLQLETKNSYYALSAPLVIPFKFDHIPLMLQYEVYYKKAITCVGAYVKLLSRTKNYDLKYLDELTPYTILFGPDICGNDVKILFIINMWNPKLQKMEEYHCKRPKFKLNDYFPLKNYSDHQYLNYTFPTYLFTLLMYPNDNFVIKLDNKPILNGNLAIDLYKVPLNNNVKALRVQANMLKCESPNYLSQLITLSSSHSCPKIIQVHKKRHVLHTENNYNLKIFVKLQTMVALALEIYSNDDSVMFDNFIITSEKKVLQKWTDDTFYAKRGKSFAPTSTYISKLSSYAQSYPLLWPLYLVCIAMPISLALIWFFTPPEDRDHLDIKPIKNNDIFLYDQLDPEKTNVYDYEFINEEIVNE